MVVAPDAAKLASIIRNLENLGRTNYSMPPEHPAAVANLVFAAKPQWITELDAIRCRVFELRTALCDSLSSMGAPASFQVLRQHRGMFSMLPFTPEQMQRLRAKHGIYGSNNGRINIAGLRNSDIPLVAGAIMETIRS